MAEVLNPKVEAHGIFDVLGMAVAKQVTERMLSPYIGNATVKSGIIKGIAGGLLYGKAGKYGNMVAGGLVIDAAEDVAVSLMAKFMGGAGQTESNPFLQ